MKGPERGNGGPTPARMQPGRESIRRRLRPESVPFMDSDKQNPIAGSSEDLVRARRRRPVWRNPLSLPQPPASRMDPSVPAEGLTIKSARRREGVADDSAKIHLALVYRLGPTATDRVLFAQSLWMLAAKSLADAIPIVPDRPLGLHDCRPRPHRLRRGDPDPPDRPRRRTGVDRRPRRNSDGDRDRFDGVLAARAGVAIRVEAGRAFGG